MKIEIGNAAIAGVYLWTLCAATLLLGLVESQPIQRLVLITLSLSHGMLALCLFSSFAD